MDNGEPSEILGDRCIKEWSSAEENIEVRHTPMPEKFYDLPPVLKLNTARHRLLAVN